MNPYAPPAAAYRCKRPLLGAYQTFGNIATLTSALAGTCVGYATRNMLLTAAVSLSFLTLWASLAAACCYLADRLSSSQDEGSMDHRKVAMPEPRKMEGDRYTPKLRTECGFTIPQVMWCISGIIGAHVLLVVLHFIAFAVFGMDQPRW